MRALLSVYDKTGLVEFARALEAAGCEHVSTGGTYQTLADAGVRVTQVSDVTTFPEILGGRVKTLHPAIHGGILARDDLPQHASELAAHGIGAIDVVVNNLYPFVETIADGGASLHDALENIDIGGPAMIRAAAKNFPRVVVVVDPADYGWVAERIASGGGLSVDERRQLARKAFQHVALYDTAIARYLSGAGGDFPAETTLGYAKLYDLRYGENPHQQAALYADPLASGGIAHAEQLHGRELSFNNILDADAAWRVASDFSAPAAVVVKHTNPCGLAVHDDQPTAYARAFEGDTVSAYGGIVGFNRTVTEATARAMRGVFYEIVVAPDYEPAALQRLSRRRNLRLLRVSAATGPLPPEVRPVSGGALLQTPDAIDEDPASWRTVTQRAPTPSELSDLAFAWKAAKHIKSNTIVLAKDRALIGMGAGQPNRVVSVHLSLRIAGERAQGSALASDAFFPFADNVEMAAQGGVAAVAQPGGSIRDEEVIAAADAAGMAMVFTGVRHFRH